MRFLIDTQLPPALARWLIQRGFEAEHVADQGMSHASDRDIWDYAVAINAIIITKGENFAIRRVMVITGPPILWLRCGNITRRALIEWLEPLLPLAVEAFARGDVLVEIT